MNYEVTIGIPVYNAEKFIRQALESALAQTFESLEFLVLDDCGTDSSMDIVREYQQKHPRGKDIRIVRQPHNMGIGAARNRIWEETQGRYLYFMDADDIIPPTAIQLLYDKVLRYNAEIVCGSHERIELYGKEEKHFLCCYPDRLFLQEDEFALWAYEKYDNLKAMVWNMLIAVDVYRNNHLSHLTINYWEDFMFTMNLPLYVSRVVLVSDVTYSYYCRNGSMSNFGSRHRIAKEEIEQTIHALQQTKVQQDWIRGKCYYDFRMYKLMVTDFYVVCTILRQSKAIVPAFSKKEIRDVMHSTFSFREVFHARHRRISCMFFYVLGVLPPAVSVMLMWMIGKMKGLI